MKIDLDQSHYSFVPFITFFLIQLFDKISKKSQ